MRGAVVVACTLIVLAVAPAARADVTIGSRLLPPPGNPVTCVQGCTNAVTSAPSSVVTVQTGGVISRWRVRAGTEVTPVRLQVVRRTGADGVEVGRSAEVTPPAGTITGYPTRLAIAPGDQIALMCCSGTSGAFFADGTGATLDRWEPPLSTLARPPESSPNLEALINADVEPDVDNDGFGDETQDTCPGVPGTTPDGCPAPAPPAPPPASPAPKPPTARFKTPACRHRHRADPADRARGGRRQRRSGGHGVRRRRDDLRPARGTLRVYLEADGRRRRARHAAGERSRRRRPLDARDRPRAREPLHRDALAEGAALGNRLRVSGRLKLPAGVEGALGCRGNVTVRLRRVKRTVALTRGCTYAARLPVRTGRPRVSFAGNSVIAPSAR